MQGRVAYLVNQYPKVSHAFIRREILALERRGLTVQRIALRGWDAPLADEADLRERTHTEYVLREGALGLLWALLSAWIATPARFVAAVALTLRVGWRSDRPIWYHFAYLAEACRIVPWLRAFGATHLHAHFATNSAEVAMLTHVLGGPPYSFTVHGTDVFDMPGLLALNDKVSRAAFVVAVSSHGRAQLCRWVEHRHWPKINVVHCGLEPDYHAVDPKPDASPRLVCVGRLCEEKGQLLLIQAAHRLASKGVDFELVLVGDGGMRAQVDKLIARYGLTRQIRITGWASSGRVRDEILAARALVLPSFAEGLPVVVIEAMALRRPVLATYVGGIPELVRHGENGWLFPAGDIAELAAAMEDCLSRPARQLLLMGEAARARVLERHSVDAAAAKLASFFREAVPGAAK